MGAGHGVRVLFGVVSPFLAVFLLFLAMYHCRNRSCNGGRVRRRRWLGWRGRPSGEKRRAREDDDEEEEAEAEELISFPGGEDLTVHAILDAPGEVVGKSNYSTLYKAWVGVSCSDDGGGGGSGRRGSLMLLRFVRPACIGRTREVLPAAQLLGLVRHPNLVPLHALYVGPRGEKLLILSFFSGGSLHHFLKGQFCSHALSHHPWENQRTTLVRSSHLGAGFVTSNCRPPPSSPSEERSPLQKP